MTDPIRTALAAAFPDRQVAAVEATDGSANPGNRTVRATFADADPAYLKVAVDGNRERLARATAALSVAAERTPVRTPRVLAADPDGAPPHLATAELAGRSVADVWWTADIEERADLARALGRALGRLHAHHVDAAGRIVGEGDGLDVVPVDWPDLLAEETGVDAVPDRFSGVPERVRAALRDHRDRVKLGDDPAPALLHGDVRPANCIVRAGEVGLLDWEQAFVGDPVFDIARAEERFLRGDLPECDRLAAALLSGYREGADRVPSDLGARRDYYRVCTFRSTVAGFDEWAPRVDEPRDELAAWVRAELDRRLARL